MRTFTVFYRSLPLSAPRRNRNNRHLAGIFPALNTVKEKARAINCMANYSSVAKAIAMYVGDNKDTLPPYYAANTNPWVTGEPLKIFIFGQGDNGMLTPYIGSISKITSAQPFGSIKQDGNRETLSCPSKAPRKEKVVNSYAVNNQLRMADNAKNGKLKLSRIRHPSQLMHIGEPDPQETSGGLSPWNVEYPGSKPGFPHSIHEYKLADAMWNAGHIGSQRKPITKPIICIIIIINNKEIRIRIHIDSLLAVSERNLVRLGIQGSSARTHH